MKTDPQKLIFWKQFSHIFPLSVLFLAGCFAGENRNSCWVIRWKISVLEQTPVVKDVSQPSALLRAAGYIIVSVLVGITDLICQIKRCKFRGISIKFLSCVSLREVSNIWNTRSNSRVLMCDLIKDSDQWVRESISGQFIGWQNNLPKVRIQRIPVCLCELCFKVIWCWVLSGTVCTSMCVI